MPKPDPNHQILWLPSIPEFSIKFLRGTSTNRGYHESWFEVVSRNELDESDFKRLDECGLLGSGQAFYVQGHTEFEDVVLPSVVDKRTGQVVPDAVPYSWDGSLVFTNTNSYKFHRYEIKRICDSGD